MAQAMWLAQYGRLVGQMHLTLYPDNSLHGADEAALQLGMRLPLQLQRLDLHTKEPAVFLRHLDPSQLTCLAITFTDGAAQQPATLPAAAALKRLVHLRQLSIKCVRGRPHDSLVVALAGMLHLTQLVLYPLSAAALAQLPSQLVQLQLRDPDCEAEQLVAGIKSLQQLHFLKLGYTSTGVQGDSPNPNYDRATNHAAVWACMPVLRQLLIGFAKRRLSPALAAGIAAATQLTRLDGWFLAEDGPEYVDLERLLSPLQQLVELRLSFTLGSVNGISTKQQAGTFGQLFSHQLTKLTRLSLGVRCERLLPLTQLLCHPTQLKQLALKHVRVGDQGLELLAANLTQLQRLTLCSCHVSVDGLVALLQAPDNLPQLAKLLVADHEIVPRVGGQDAAAALVARIETARASIDVSFQHFYVL
jgi:hypothetical protein